MVIEKNLAIKMLRNMLRIRYFEEQVEQFYIRGEIGGGHLYIGMEAVAVGTISILRKTDLITTTHRGHGHCIAKDFNMKNMMAELLGKATGYCKGKGGSMHIADITLGNLGANGIVGGGIPIATGAALAIKKMKKNNVVLCFFGDGAINEGVFHESINMASIWKLPIIYIIENNKYGMGFPIEKAVNIKNLSNRACAYGVKGVTIDGNDLVGIYHTTKKLINNIRKGDGPILLECITYRWKGHSRSDAERYRNKKEVIFWMEKCPIVKYKTYLQEKNIIKLSDIEIVEKEVMTEIKEAAKFARDSAFPNPRDALEDVYA